MKKIFIFLVAISLMLCVGFASTESNETVSYIYVDVKGEVENPGVYRVSDSCRMFQILELAGGLTVDADTSTINLASKITDEQIIKIPELSGIEENGLININTANTASLDTLPNVGYDTASKIVQYRQDNGPFKTIADIKNVSGIGDATFEKIKNLITV